MPTTETAVAIKERPILFSGAMVNAILEGRKTQTRRVIQFPRSTGAFVCVQGFWKDHPLEWWPLVSHDGESVDDGNGCEVPLRCPYGLPGDKLWVREAFNSRWLDRGVLYRADGGSAREAGYPKEPQWTPSIHMPRKYSRITLEITDVRVQRVQEISVADALSEGISINPDLPVRTAHDGMAVDTFAHLWDSINARRGHSWENNPWVWAITFKRMNP